MLTSLFLNMFYYFLMFLRCRGLYWMLEFFFETFLQGDSDWVWVFLSPLNLRIWVALDIILLFEVMLERLLSVKCFPECVWESTPNFVCSFLLDWRRWEKPIISLEPGSEHILREEFAFFLFFLRIRSRWLWGWRVGCLGPFWNSKWLLLRRCGSFWIFFWYGDFLISKITKSRL